MKSLSFYLLIILVFIACIKVVYAQGQDTLWQKLKPYFNPPPKYAGEFGKYRSPLKFYDGSLVKTISDWKSRRKEIINRWEKMMGPWPELISKPSVEIIETTHR